MTLDDDSAILTLPPSPPESLAPGNLGLSPSSSPPPILLRFPLHRRSRGILHLEPVGRAAGTVGSFRFDTIPSSPITTALRASTPGIPIQTRSSLAANHAATTSPRL